MFSRVARYVPASAQGACKAQLPGAVIMTSQQTRGMATAQQLKGRIKTVTNIGKITKAMKMVAAAKLRSVQSKLENARAFQESAASSFTDRGDYEGAKKHLIVPLTSDRGLCGAINSSVFKAVRTMINDSVAKGREVTILATGEKGKAAMDRLYRKHFTEMLSEFGKFHPVTFSECCVLAEYILSQEFDYATIIYNRFKSAISYATTPVEFASLKHFKGEKEFWDKFDFEGEPRELLEDYHQFRLAVRLYHFFAENATSEQSARMTAMENSSRNAGDMLERLRLIYNRTRQAKITTELSEIISGASSLQG